MKRGKRIIVASVSGIACGFICLGLASSGGTLPWPVSVQIIVSRSLIGFAIGISAVSIGHWSLNGVVMGALFSLPLGFSGLMAPENPEFSKTMMLVSTLVMGMIYGLIIETVTSLVFKARITS